MPDAKAAKSAGSAKEIRCPRCTATETKLSTQWEPTDLLMRALLRRPMRCLRCYKRFYVFDPHIGTGW